MEIEVVKVGAGERRRYGELLRDVRGRGDAVIQGGRVAPGPVLRVCALNAYLL